MADTHLVKTTVQSGKYDKRTNSMKYKIETVFFCGPNYNWAIHTTNKNFSTCKKCLEKLKRGSRG